MSESTKLSPPDPAQRCAGPNCGMLRGAGDQWWLMWLTYREGKYPVLSICPWEDHVATQEGAMPVCGEMCAQKLQSQFMGNVLRERRPARTQSA
ncbi:MAG TPA: hypothetical protein VGR48_04790 [Terriglobales bacterium]|nr:hypothetical protein [Terriglobales bacterium]